MLGPFERFLFTKVFLDRAYATFMKSAMNAIERYALQSAEREPGPDDSRLPGEAHNHGSPPARNSPRH
jgi:hypothetical protein